MGIDNNLITKSNFLVEANYKLNLEEQRVILYLVSKISPEDADFKEYEINVKKFTEILNIKTNAKYCRFKQIAKSLIKQTLTIKPNSNQTTITSWLSSATYFDKEGKIFLTFDPKLKPYLLQLKNKFTSYKLENVLHLKSVYSIRLYELLKQYQKIGCREIKIDELRKILDIPQGYIYADIKRTVLLKPQKELKEKTDIFFDFEEIKVGRKVDKIKFIIHKNIDCKPESLKTQNTEEIETIDINVNEDVQSLYLDKLNTIKWILREESISKKDLIAILESANGDLELINKRYEYAKLSKKANMTGFLIWACKNKDTDLESKKTLRIGIKQEKNLNYMSRSIDSEKLAKLEQQHLREMAGEI